jgi:glycosyltransferase involved in cell wall biosynthesis
MNVIFALPEGLTLGGVTSLSIEMCRELVKLGQSAALIEHSTMYGNPKLDFDLPQEVKVVSCADLLHPDDPRLDVAEYLPAYRSVLPGVFIPNWAYGTFAACAELASNEAERLRIIGYAHADEPGYYDWLTHYEPIIHRFIASTRDIVAKLAKLLPHRQSDMFVRPNPVNVPPVLRRSYTGAQMPVQLVYVARIVQRQKRVYDLVELASELAAKNVEFELRIIGDGVDKETLHVKFDGLPRAIRERVTLESSVAPGQLPEIWQASDISLLVSEYEGTSLAMLESMAYGCVPVVTQVGGTSMIKSGVNGYCVPVGSITEMAQIIKSLANERPRLTTMGQNAHTTIRSHLNYEQCASWFLQMVHAVWEEPPRCWPADRPLLRVGQPPQPPSDLPLVAEEIMVESER